MLLNPRLSVFIRGKIFVPFAIASLIEMR